MGIKLYSLTFHRLKEKVFIKEKLKTETLSCKHLIKLKSFTNTLHLLFCEVYADMARRNITKENNFLSSQTFHSEDERENYFPRGNCVRKIIDISQKYQMKKK